MSWLSSAIKKNPKTTARVVSALAGNLDPVQSTIIKKTIDKKLSNDAKKKKNESGGGAAEGGGGGGGGGGGDGGGQSVAEILAAYLAYQPQFASQTYDLTSQYLPKYSELNRTEATKERGATLKDVANLSPQLQGIRTAAEDPRATALRGELWKQIAAELAAGGDMTPEEDRRTQQTIRSSLFARGMGNGNSGAMQESLRRALASRSLSDSRQSKATSFLAQEAAQSPDPFASILGYGTPNLNLAANQTAQGNTAGASNFWAATSAANQNQQTALQSKALDNDAAKYSLALSLAQKNPYLYELNK